MNTQPQSQQPPHIVAVPSLPKIAFVEARFYRRGRRRKPAIWAILHATHGAEGRTKAEDCARMFQTRPPTGPKTSAHCVIDTDSAVQCVPWECEAWHCGPTGNVYGEGFELCGDADQTQSQWLDALSLPMLNIAAHVVRWRCEMLGIPLVYVRKDELRGRQPGITTHADIAQAFPFETDHYDPGPGFPMSGFLAAVNAQQ